MKSVICGIILLAFASSSLADDWKELRGQLVREYDGTIQSVERLDAGVCRVVVVPTLSNRDCMTTAKNIGYFIRNSTSGTQGARPVVQVLRKGRQIAVARPHGRGYVGEMQFKDLGASGSGGDY